MRNGVQTSGSVARPNKRAGKREKESLLRLKHRAPESECVLSGVHPAARHESGARASASETEELLSSLIDAKSYNTTHTRAHSIR